MTLTIVVLDQEEKFLEFLDPDRCDLQESIEYGGLRTLTFEYKFEDLLEDKELFRLGNKLWIQGDTNLRDCLYVMNTEVKEDIRQENSFKLELEEVLVELNYAPLFSQTELLKKNGFRIQNNNDSVEVYVDWNALNRWFGDYFNIGVVQDCLSDYASKVTLSGTMNRMNLLRQIEEETGNVFVTRYEKDVLNNTIHRYLDFLNPLNSNKNWTLTLLYDFWGNDTNIPCVDKDGNPCEEDKAPEVTPFDDGIPAESIPEDTDPWDESQEDDVERNYDWIPEDETIEEYYTDGQTYEPMINLNPEACQFQICNSDGDVLNTDGEPYTDGDTALSWNCSDAGLTGDKDCYTITLCRFKNNLGITVNNVSYVVSGIVNDVSTPIPYSSTLQTDGKWTVASDLDRQDVLLPDDIYFEIYDYSINQVVFRTKLDHKIGTVHDEILDFGFNIDNITYNINETNTYSAVSPVITPNREGSMSTLSRTDISTIINRWQNLSVTKGLIYPMIVQKVNIEATSLANAKSKLGAYDVHYNYWARPLKPNDNTDNDPKQYEFYRATAYWRAPYTKFKGDLHVSTTKGYSTQYAQIRTRPDTRSERGVERFDKMGTTESSDEDVYAIYNQVALYLKEHEVPEVDIDVDVANLRGHEYNNYDLHDKVYVKMPNTGELLTARVTKTTKEAHDIAKNTVELSNYRAINTVKTITNDTYIESGNINFKYPASKKLIARLVNADYDSNDEYSIQYPANKLLTFTLYKIDNGSQTYTGKTYTRTTTPNGYATIELKLDPGDYEMGISFVGDEEFEESSLTVKVNVGGTLPDTSKKTTNDKKTNKKTKYKTVKRYWTKCGLSPNKKKIVAIGKPSAPGEGKYSYTLYKTVFKNKCPHCGNASLVWGYKWGRGKVPCTGTYEGGSSEGHIFCKSCDADYGVINGREHINGSHYQLKTLSKPVKSSEKEANLLKKGKLVYDKKKVKVGSKNNTNTKDRKVRSKNIAKYVKQKALAIVGNKTGKEAAMAIVKWIDKTSNMKYSKYYNFKYSPTTCLKRGSANCCDGTRLFFQLMDAAGCSEFYKMYYVHVSGHVYGLVVSKKSGKRRYVDCASDYHSCWGYVCRGYPHGSATSRYPKLPF